MNESEIYAAIYPKFNRRERKPVKTRRNKVRPGRLRGKALGKLRVECWERDGGKCVDCGKDLPLDGDLFTRMHMAHVKGKRMFGDNLANVVSKCHECHIVKEHCGGKVVPRKERTV